MNKYLLVLISLVFLLSFPQLASAKSPFKSPNATPTFTPTSSPRPNVTYQPQNKLQGGSLAACQAHEQVIRTRTKNLVKYANTMLDTFNKIVTRVEDYYNTSLVPAGKMLDNYTTLLDDVNAKRTVVQNDLNTAQTDADTFSCTGIDPKNHLTQFRVDMQETKKSLKEYRTSIKNLIVAVHQLASPSGTPTPTVVK